MIEAKEIVELIQQSNRIVITGHKNPDGDSVGSSLALYHFVKALGKDAAICHPDPCPEFLNWIKGKTEIAEFDHEEKKVTDLLLDADLIFCLDYNGASRLGEGMGAVLEMATGKKVMIDHHMQPDDFVDIAVSHPEVCSTCQLIFELIEHSGYAHLLNVHIGEAVYLGLMTDTGSFRFPAVEPRTHEIAAKILSLGVEHWKIHESTYDHNRVEKIKLRSHILVEHLELLTEYKVAIISVSEEELNSFNYVQGDTEGLVNIALSLEGVNVAVFFSERNGRVKISFRSKGNAFVNELAKTHFNGGGHKFAAGGISDESLEATIEKFKSVIPNYFS